MCFVFAEEAAPEVYLEDEDISEVYIPGYEKSGFVWALEYGESEDEEQVLCVKAMSASHKNRKEILCLGPVVSIITSNNLLMYVVIESRSNNKWGYLDLPVSKYSSKLNVEWAARSEKSVISMGFFPSKMSAQDLLEKEGPCGVSGVDIVFGFSYCRNYILNNEDECLLPATWKLMQLMEASKLQSRLQPLDDACVFSEKFDEEQCKKWIASILKRNAKKKHSSAKSINGPAKGAKHSNVSAVDSPNDGGGLRKGEKRKRVEKTAKPRPKVRARKSGNPLSASLSDVIMHPEDSSCPQDAPTEKNVTDGVEALKEIERYYIFGMREIFDIPVESIMQPSAALVYRMFNKEHAMEIANSMIKNPSQVPAIAELIPYSAKSKKLLHFENSPQELKKFLWGVKHNEVQFLAISGQHSARAAQWVIEWAKKDAKLSEVAESLQYRKSRILSDITPRTILAQHSSRSNAVNETMEFKSCFLETVVHARRQFDECGRPNRPTMGTNKTTDLQKYQVC